MRARLEEFALTLHPEKTRLIEFGRFAAANRARAGLGKPETFHFLGFTHICGRSRRGGFQLKRKSRRDRMRATLRAVREALRRRMHQPIPVQGRWLKQVVTGYFAYHGVPTNGGSLGAFRYHVTDLWRRTLRRQRGSLTVWFTDEAVEAWAAEPRTTRASQPTSSACPAAPCSRLLSRGPPRPRPWPTSRRDSCGASASTWCWRSRAGSRTTIASCSPFSCAGSKRPKRTLPGSTSASTRSSSLIASPMPC